MVHHFRKLVTLSCAAAFCVAGQDVEVNTPYVPSPSNTVTAMLKLAGVQKTDTVYDLGSGDGRIVIAAAKEFGARGVGIDINPERVARAQVKAEKAGVGNRTKFEVGDLFNADIRNATVVTLYLLPDVNARVRSKLLTELKPGTRIVSHEFGIKDWPADKEIVVNGSKLYLWTVPEKKITARRICTACAPTADLLP